MIFMISMHMTTAYLDSFLCSKFKLKTISGISKTLGRVSRKLNGEEGFSINLNTTK